MAAVEPQHAAPADWEDAAVKMREPSPAPQLADAHVSPTSFSSGSCSTQPGLPPGLCNLGNTCYLNAVLQVLYRARPLRDALLAFRPGSETFEARLAAELRAVFRALDNAADHARESPSSVSREGITFVSPRTLVALLRQVERTEFEAEGQQDAQEFLRFLLDKVHGALVAAAKEPENESAGDSSDTDPAPGTDGPQDAQDAQDDQDDQDAQDDLEVAAPPSKKPRHSPSGDSWVRTPSPQVVEDVFQGRVETVTKCMVCENGNSRSENFLDLSLPAEVGKSLSWALATHAKDDMLDGPNKYACEFCNTYQEARRSWHISAVPPTFTVHLKLFACGIERPFGAKLPAAMSCPFSMKLTSYCSSSCLQKHDLYRLRGIIVHEGSSSSSGHYYCYSYVEGTGWHMFDDAEVCQVSEDTIRGELFTGSPCKNTAYLLFYERATPMSDCTG